MDALPYVAWFKDAEGRYESVNDHFLDYTGKELDDVLGRKGGEVLEKEEAAQAERGDQDAKNAGKPTRANYSLNQRVYKTVRFPVFDDRGTVRGIGGFREDITNLSSSLQQLHREKEYLEALLDNIPYYIFFTDRHHRYIRINGMMAHLLRINSPDEAVGKGNEQFFSKRMARKMLEENRSIIETGKPVLNKIIYFEDDGVEGFWLENNKIPIRDERGIITMIVGIFKDVSGLKEIENELKEARDKAREADRLKTSFLANMSHEIRTPMNGILGFANLLKDPDLEEDKKDLYLKHIEQSSNQLMNIIDDIIDISKIESGQLKISNRPVRINPILEEVYSSFFHRIRGDAPGQKKVTFHLIKGMESPGFTMVTDDFRLRQILNNLISNAIKFTHEGRIEFGYHILHNRTIEFFVSDTGMGIPLNKQGIIFDRFGQVDRDKEYQPSGTGLGLPISKNLVKLMGGEMWVESTVNEGSTFYFTLPMVMEKSVDEPRKPLSNKSYNWKERTILVAEDEPLNWMFIKEMLGHSGAEVIRAKNGREAIKLTRERKPDVILMDLKMPEVSGIEATRSIRRFNNGIPIIAQTAFVMAEEKEESLKAGCDFFVTKPLDRTELMEIIDNCFRRNP